MSDQPTHRELTEQQKAFVLHYTSTAGAVGNAAAAAREAGYSVKTSAEQGAQLLKKPHVQAAIDVALREAIGVSLSVKAVAVIESILDSKDASLKLKGDLAVKVIELSGLADRTQTQKAKDTGLAKPLGEQSRAELEAFVQRAMAEMRGEAQTDERPSPSKLN